MHIGAAKQGMVFVLKVRRQLPFFVSRSKRSAINLQVFLFISVFAQFCDVLALHLDAFDTAMNYSCFVFPDSFEYSLLPSTR